MPPLPAIQDLINLQAEHGLNNYRLSALSGYDDSLLSRWQRGISGPTVVALNKIAEVFGHEVRLVPKAGAVNDAPIYLPKFLPRRTS